MLTQILARNVMYLAHQLSKRAFASLSVEIFHRDHENLEKDDGLGKTDV